MIKHPKRRGEWVELQFMARAAHHGLTVSKPWGDSARYDFIVEHRGRFLRVQVKSTMNHHKSGYLCACHGWNKDWPYDRTQIDFLAVFVIPEDVWYIIPVAHICKTAITLEPRRPHNKYFPYLEAWHLLRRRSAGRAPARPPEPSPARQCRGVGMITSESRRDARTVGNRK